MPGYKYSPKAASRPGSLRSHVRYDHGLIPKQLHVWCPRCSALATATNTLVEARYMFLDFSLGPLRASWSLSCSQCVHRADQVDYENLPQLFWRVAAAGVELWAWNREHLIMLRKLLANESIASDPYEPLATYARREWLRKGKRMALVKAISRVLGTPRRLTSGCS